MDIRNVIEGLALLGGIAGLVQLVRLSSWIGEMKTKVNVMWDAFTNDLQMKHLHERFKEQMQQRKGGWHG